MSQNGSGPPLKGERALIARLRSVVLGNDRERRQVPFGDDGASLPAPEEGWIWTTDILTAGTDFVPGRDGWRAVGRKAMAVNLSDCAAMAAAPRAALCGVVLEDSMSPDDGLELLRGVCEAGAEFGCPVVGGDTNSWRHPAVISVTVAGRVEPGRQPVLRSGARPGDVIFVSGGLGGSILGRHLSFTPRVALALELNRRARPHAMIDISDGLSVDLRHVLEASQCAAELEREQLERVIHDDARRLAAQDGVSALEHALHDGEDFELIVVLDSSLPSSAWEGLGLTRIGRVVTGEPRIEMLTGGGVREEIPPRGWEHFRG